MQHKYELSSPVININGVGKAKAEKLAKLGIHTVGDLLYYFPRAYENRGNVALLGDYITDIPRSYILTVASNPTSVKIKAGMTITKFRAFDNSGTCEVIFFNAPFVKDVFHIGDSFRFYGKTSFTKVRRLNLTNPKYEPIVFGKTLADFVPIYSLTDGITSKAIDKLIREAINDIIPFLKDPIPQSITLKEGLPSLGYAIQNIHFPESTEALLKAQHRLAFDEMFYFGISIALSKSQRSFSSGVRFKPCSIKPFLDLLPYELTDSQKTAVNDIYKDTVMSSMDENPPAMARILVGDVGCGKTVCAALAMYIAYKSGYQSALMVPTEILATQHYHDISDLFSKLGINVALLTGSCTQKKKQEIYLGLINGSIDIVIGTHALISEKVDFASLGLIITDEQHRFGVKQRGVLKDKTKNAHMLVMSATPIPRSLALAMYGDLDISRITELPKGRQRVDTYVVDESYRTRLNSFISKQVAIGGQCYIVCPSIEANDDEGDIFISDNSLNGKLVEGRQLNLKNAVEYTEDIKKALPNLTIDCLHGQIKNAEKDEIMARFSSGKTDVLVSTTVIEVGVNVPNASLMIVENAERFGLSQLHQLRGRVGRGSRKSYCILVSDNKTEKAKARLEVMRTTYDGYEIAEKDLLLRGPGDFFSSVSDNSLRQSGGFDFKFTSTCEDTQVMEKAFSQAKGIINADPNLDLPEHSLLKERIKTIITNESTIS